MNKIEQDVKKARDNGKEIYIRGYCKLAFNLGICLDSVGIKLEGYFDVDESKMGQEDHWGRKCISHKLVNKNCYVLCVIQNEKAKNSVAIEYEEQNVECVFLSASEIEKWMRNLDDATFLKEYYHYLMGKTLNLDNPHTLCEKLQWLKLYDRNPLYTKLADKYEVRKYVADTIGEDYLVPNCGVWERFDDIDFEKLPNAFVLKCTHNSGSFYVVKDKKNFDKAEAKRVIESRMNDNYFYHSREWVYKDIEPRIIADLYIDTLGNEESVEYKITCFNGKVDFVTFCKGKAHAGFNERTNDHYDINFKKQHWYVNYKNTDIEWEKPEQWDELIEISEKLAKNIPYVRVDFYIDKDKIYFGEMTFYTWAGFMKFEPEEWDRKLGDRLILPEKIK